MPETLILAASCGQSFLSAAESGEPVNHVSLFLCLTLPGGLAEGGLHVPSSVLHALETSIGVVFCSQGDYKTVTAKMTTFDAMC